MRRLTIPGCQSAPALAASDGVDLSLNLCASVVLCFVCRLGNIGSRAINQLEHLNTALSKREAVLQQQQEMTRVQQQEMARLLLQQQQEITKMQQQEMTRVILQQQQENGDMHARRPAEESSRSLGTAGLAEWLAPGLHKVIGNDLEELCLLNPDDMRLLQPNDVQAIMAKLNRAQMSEFHKKIMQLVNKMKTAYKGAKAECDADPSNRQLSAAYDDSKRRYQELKNVSTLTAAQLALPTPQPGIAGFTDGFTDGFADGLNPKPPGSAKPDSKRRRNPPGRGHKVPPQPAAAPAPSQDVVYTRNEVEERLAEQKRSLTKALLQQQQDAIEERLAEQERSLSEVLRQQQQQQLLAIQEMMAQQQPAQEEIVSAAVTKAVAQERLGEHTSSAGPWRKPLAPRTGPSSSGR